MRGGLVLALPEMPGTLRMPRRAGFTRHVRNGRECEEETLERLAMDDLTKLTAEELLERVTESAYKRPKTLAEIRRRLERLEKCEAALDKIQRIPVLPFPDRIACERAFANAVWRAWNEIQQAAGAALEGK